PPNHHVRAVQVARVNAAESESPILIAGVRTTSTALSEKGLRRAREHGRAVRTVSPTRRSAREDDRFHGLRARMAVHRGCRAPHARSAQWQSHGPIKWVAILRRGARPGGCAGRGTGHLPAAGRGCVLAEEVGSDDLLLDRLLADVAAPVPAV